MKQALILNHLNVMKGNDVNFKFKLEKIISGNLKNEELTVEWLARQMYCSERQFYRLVKKHTGKTVSRYIREIRLETAKALLQTDIYTVKEVAYMVGYQKASWFSTQYFLYYGERPKNK